jgi:hypothetical protein
MTTTPHDRALEAAWQAFGNLEGEDVVDYKVQLRKALHVYDSTLLSDPAVLEQVAKAIADADGSKGNARAWYREAQAAIDALKKIAVVV